jgi:hypothetical protein
MTKVPEILEKTRQAEAVALLKRYFATKDGQATHTGSHFDIVGHPWNDPAHADEITSSDLLALSTLSVAVKGRSAIAATSPDFQTRTSELLKQIPLNASLGDPEAFDEYLAENGPGRELWRCVDDVWGFAGTYTSKLLARKRANLFPVYDKKIKAAWALTGPGEIWRPMHQALSADGGALMKYAEELRVEAEVSEAVSPLRVLDSIVWRWQKDQDR